MGKSLFAYLFSSGDPVYEAARGNNYDKLKKALEDGEYIDSNAMTFAVMRNNHDMVLLLLQHNAPMHMDAMRNALDKNNKTIAKTLMEANAPMFWGDSDHRLLKEIRQEQAENQQEQEWTPKGGAFELKPPPQEGFKHR